jgi:hypothetical protein
LNEDREDQGQQPEFDPPQTATPGPPPGAPPTPPPPTEPEPSAAPPATPSPPAPGPPPPPPPGYAAPAQPAPYGYQTQPVGQRTSGKAVAALVLGIGGWLVAPFILSVLGIVFGALARKEIANDPAIGGRAMANWGFWLSITGLAAWVVLIIVLVAVGTSNSS